MLRVENSQSSIVMILFSRLAKEGFVPLLNFQSVQKQEIYET